MQNVLSEINAKYPERKITVLAGVEEVLRYIGGVWYIKTGHCVRCGECCKRVPAHWRWGINKDGHCKFLMTEGKLYSCGMEFPFGCISGDDSGKEYCSVKWGPVNG